MQTLFQFHCAPWAAPAAVAAAVPRTAGHGGPLRAGEAVLLAAMEASAAEGCLASDAAGFASALEGDVAAAMGQTVPILTSPRVYQSPRRARARLAGLYM